MQNIKYYNLAEKKFVKYLNIYILRDKVISFENNSLQKKV